MEMQKGNTSFFDGGLLEYLGWAIMGSIVTALTLGFGAPIAICWMYKWKIDHTVVDGKRMVFFGRASSLFVHWIKWFLLTIITLGIYGFWLHIKLEQWKVSHTTFR